MKTILFTLALSLTAAIMTAQTETTTLEEVHADASLATPSLTAEQTEVASDGTSITVTVPVHSDKGSVFISLHTEDTFMRKGYLDLEGQIIDGKAVVTFENIPAGTYGILLFHDTNGNKKMDFELNGMPKEMYGISNNIMSFGPPMWSDAKFEVGTEPVALEVRM